MKKLGPWQIELWDRIKMAPGDGCWEWQRGCTGRGYPSFTINGRHRYAHRLAWESVYGSIPSGLDILHSCDNTRCCRPQHLSTGTHAENMEDMKRKGRAFRMIGENHVGHILTEVDVLRLRDLRKNKEPVKSLMKIFGVSHSTVEKIISGHLWKHLN